MSEQDAERAAAETEMLAVAVRVVTNAFDDFISECLKNGAPVAPSKGAVSKARAMLPFWCTNAYKKEV